VKEREVARYVNRDSWEDGSSSSNVHPVEHGSNEQPRSQEQDGAYPLSDEQSDKHEAGDPEGVGPQSSGFQILSPN